MSDLIYRHADKILSVKTATTEAVADEIDISKYSSGMIFIGANSHITAIAFYGAPYSLHSDDAINRTRYTHVPLYDTAPASATATVINISTGPASSVGIQIPKACFGARSLKLIVSLSAGTTELVDVSLGGL